MHSERRDYATVDLARIRHHQTQQSITDWHMIGFGHYRTDITDGRFIIGEHATGSV